MNRITLEDAEKLIKSSNGEIFSVTFKKKDGTMRTLTGRLGVKEGLKGTGMAYEPGEYDMIPIYDMEKESYRMVNLTTVTRITTSGTEYTVAENEET